jgi:heat shock protein HslJ
MKTWIIITLTIFLTYCKGAQSDINTTNASLTNTYWKLVEVDSKTVVTASDNKEVHMVLAAEGSNQNLKGFAGCNSLGGSFSLEGNNSIKFSIMTTKMYCNERMDIEKSFTQALSQANIYTIKGEKLELYRDQELLARFESVWQKN